MMYQITAGEVVLFIGLLANAAAVFYTAFVNSRNSRKVDLVIGDVKKIEVSTNSMKDELIIATKTAALLEGKEEAKKEVEEEIKKDLEEIKQEIKKKK